MAVEKIGTEMFESRVLHSSKPVLVDFYADWCGPCKMLSPIVEEIAGAGDAYEVFKLNVDEAPDVASRYGVMSIPTLIAFRDGKEAQRKVGVQSKQAILAMLG